MFTILNPEFMRFEVETVYDSDNMLYRNLINIFTDPKDFELPQYRNTPFASIVIESIYRLDEIEEPELIKVLEKANYAIHSMYKTDDKYDKLTEPFKSNHRYHTLIFESTLFEMNIPKKSIVLFCIPCKGIIREIKKSEYYKLYNASMVTLKSRPIKWENEFYDKLVYGLVDIDAYFQFEELVYTESEKDIRKANIHQFTIDFALIDSVGTDKSKPLYFNNQCGIDTILKYNRIQTYIPCMYSEERSELFQYFGKNIFKLSDIPESISRKGSMISRRVR